MAAGITAPGCVPPAKEKNAVSPLQADTAVMESIAIDNSMHQGTGNPEKLQNNITRQVLPLADKQPPAAERIFSEADKTYIDWIIPDYPDVILLHEGSAETLNYTEQVYRYLKSKKGSVRKKVITQKHADKARDKRLYIDDVGENWYEVFVFDEWR